MLTVGGLIVGVKFIVLGQIPGETFMAFSLICEENCLTVMLKERMKCY